MAEKKADLMFRMDGAPLMYRNFAGRKTQFNREGDRNFCIDLTGEDVDQLLADGWNVKWTKPRDDDEYEPRPFLPVAVKYNFKPPRIVLVTSRKQTNLTEDMLEVLDFAEITNVDIIVRGWHWVTGEGTEFEKQGVKAEVKTMYITIFEDELELKYSDGAPPISEISED